MTDKRTLIITGGTGFIGSYLLKRLLLDGYKVYAISRKINQDFIHPCLTWVTWDSYKNNIPKGEEIYAVFNLATTYGQNDESEKEILNCNVTLSINLFKYALKMGVKKIINTDTFFGKPEYDYQHLRTYISSKNQLVKEARKLTKHKKISLINLRLEHVFGANDSENKFVTNLLKSFFQKKLFL